MSTGPCSIIFPMASCKQSSQLNLPGAVKAPTRGYFCYTYVNVINVEDFGLETQAERFGLLDGVGQLTVRLRTDEKHIQHEHGTNLLSRRCLKRE